MGVHVTILNMMVIIFWEMIIRATRRHLPEDDNQHSHRRGNLKSYNIKYVKEVIYLSLVVSHLQMAVAQVTI
jgi:hypothetical protein